MFWANTLSARQAETVQVSSGRLVTPAQRTAADGHVTTHPGPAVMAVAVSPPVCPPGVNGEMMVGEMLVVRLASHRHLPD